MGFEKRFLVTQSRGQAALETQNFGHTTPCKADPRGFERPHGRTASQDYFQCLGRRLSRKTIGPAPPGGGAGLQIANVGSRRARKECRQ